MKRIDGCRVCGNKQIREFFDLGNEPFANSLLDSLEETEKAYPLSLSWCPDCNLVQLNHTAEPKELFSTYVWVTGTSKGAKRHAIAFRDEALARVKGLEKSYVLEVASNDGTFLLAFMEKNYRVLGIDPARNIVDLAIAQGVPSVCGFFGVKLATQIVREHGTAKVVFARNVVAHVANLHDFVEGLSRALDDEGVLALESHYAKKICEELQYDSIYHEHLCYYTLESTERLLMQHGLNVFDVLPSPISGGAFIVYASKSKRKESASLERFRLEEEETKVNEFASWDNFARRAYQHREALLSILGMCVANEEKIIGYGASARSSTMLNFCGIDTRYLPIIADKNTLKHKKYTAGTHIPIDDPVNAMKSKPDTVFILAWNFTDEIIDYLRKEFGFKGKFIIPLPNNPRIIRG
jgi:SAM-dependent methyltransferase